MPSVWDHEWRMLKAGLVVRMEGGGLRSCYAGTLRSRIDELRIEAMPSQMNITERGIVNAHAGVERGDSVRRRASHFLAGVAKFAGKRWPHLQAAAPAEAAAPAAEGTAPAPARPDAGVQTAANAPAGAPSGATPLGLAAATQLFL
eukprot:7388948-Prymnesium_polylepis.1